MQLSKWLRKGVAFSLLALSAPLIYFIWYHNRPLPDAISQQPLFPGITYSRIIQRTPRPLIYHIAAIDLTTPGLRFFATPSDEIDGFAYRARTTSQFLQENNLNLAINADFFDPWRDYGPFDYYPHVGDGVNARGLTIANGQIATEGYVSSEYYATLYITADNQASFQRPAGEVQTAVSGNVMLLINGQLNPQLLNVRERYLIQRHPRTVVALDESTQKLLFFVVDGRQPNYSDGATFEELAALVQEHGGYNALNLDGGGSAVMVAMGDDGTPHQLSSSIHTRIPGRERPIANHLGVVIGE